MLSYKEGFLTGSPLLFDWTTIIVRVVAIVLVGGVAVLAFFKAQRDARKGQKLEDAALATANTYKVEETSHEAVERAESRADPAAHSSTAGVSGADLPDWTKRQ